MRRVLLFLLALVLLFIVMAGAAVFWRKPLAAFAITRALNGAGFDQAAVEVAEFSLTKIRIQTLSAQAKSAQNRGPAAPSIQIDEASVGFDVPTLLRLRRVGAVEIGPGQLSLTVDDNGVVSLTGLRARTTSTDKTNAPPNLDHLPFDSLDITKGLAVVIDTPRGALRARVDGLIVPTSESRLNVNATATEAGVGVWRMTDAIISATIEIARDQSATFAAQLRASIGVGANTEADTDGAVIDGLDAQIDGRIQSWRTLLETRDPTKAGVVADLRMSSATMSAQSILGLVEDRPADADAMMAALPGGAVGNVSVSGFARVDATPAATRLSMPEGAFFVTTDRGDELRLQSADDGPIFEVSAAGQRLSLDATLTGPSSAALTLLATTADNEFWRIKMNGRAQAQTLAGVTLGDSMITLDGAGDFQRFAGDLSATGQIKSASVGRLLVNDAQTRLVTPLEVSLAEQTLALGAPDGPDPSCVHFDKGRFRVVSEDLAASVWDADACAQGAPLLTAQWAQPGAQASLAARLTTRRGFFRLGQTLLTGAPPDVDLTATYQPAAEETHIAMQMNGGRVTFNDTVVFSESTGQLDAHLVGPTLTAEVTLEQSRIDQANDAPTMAPIIANGAAQLNDDKLAFTFGAQTLPDRAAPQGFDIGAGRGMHDVNTGKGFTEFRTGELVFSTDGLQPDDLTPLATGLVFDATGQGRAAFQFNWTAQDFTSAGTIDFSDIAFGGPGLAVSRTAGVSGALALTSLLPASTDGEQRIDIGLVDLDALKLENGVVRFELPGDETLKIVHAEFPWFGGRIGAYDTISPLSGGVATTRLQAADVDLGEMLEFVNVDGLSGAGVVEGVLPLIIEDGIARIEGGALKAVGPGVIRYTGAISDAAVGEGEDSALAFKALREVKYETLAATIDGRLDGDLEFGINFDGASTVRLDDPRIKEPVTLPFIYRINVKAPLLRLIEQANEINNIQLKLQERAAEKRRNAEGAQ